MRTRVLISGATGGLGKAFSAECASRGWDLFLTDRFNEPLTTLADGLTKMYGVDIKIFPADLTNQHERKLIWENVANDGFNIHMLVNIAGIDYEGLFDNLRVEEIRTIMRLNVEATVEMTHQAMGFRDPTRTFHIINVSSLAAFFPMPVKAVYASSKRFLLDWSTALHQELRPQNISVLALCPAGMPSTPNHIASIEAQGFAGRITTVNVGFVAEKTLDKALAGQSLYIPGFLNQFLVLVGRMVPPGLSAALVDRRWRKTNAHVRDQQIRNHHPLTENL